MWGLCDEWCFCSKNLRNKVLFILNCSYNGVAKGKKELLELIPDYVDLISEKGFIDRYKLSTRMATVNDESYRAMPKAQSAQQVIAEVYQEFKEFYQSIKAKKTSGDKKHVRPPKYKDKQKGRHVVTFTNQDAKIKNGELFYAKGKKFLGLKTKLSNFQQVKIIPRTDGTFILLIIYNKENSKKSNGQYSFGIDLGMKNLMTVTSDKADFRPRIVNGRPLVSLNEFWNLRVDDMKSLLPKRVYTSKVIENLTRKRNNQIDDFLHKASRKVIDLAVANDVSRIVIGYNKGWKFGKKHLRKKTRRVFVQIPFLRLIKMLVYKAEDVGIEVVTTRESHTSKCSALDLEPICHHERYMGKRSHRGRYSTATGIKLNADVNGSLNILRLINGDEFITRLDKGCVLQPKRLAV